MNKEITLAIKELNQAKQNFNYAAPEFIITAITLLNGAEMRVNALLNQRKENGPTRMDPWVREKPLTKLFKNIVPQQDQVVKREIEVEIVNLSND